MFRNDLSLPGSYSIFPNFIIWTLLFFSSSLCANTQWVLPEEFENPNALIYDEEKIEISNGQARLKKRPALVQGLVAYWQFDDEPGKADPGLLTDTQIVGSPIQTAGLINNAIKFESPGTGEYLTADISNSLNTSLDGIAWSASFWMKPDIVGFEPLLSQGAPYNRRSRGWDLIWHGEHLGELEFRLQANTWPAVKITSPGLGNLAGHWHHIVLTVERGASVNIYLDGNLVASGSIAAQVGALSNDELRLHTLGGSDFSDNTPTSYDELALYNRVLNSEDVKNLYSNGSGTTATLFASEGPILQPAIPVQPPGSGSNGTEIWGGLWHSVSLNTDLVAYWQMDDKPPGEKAARMSDGSMLRNNGRVVGDVNQVQGVRASGLRFDADALAYAKVPVHPEFSFNQQNEWSVAGWFRPEEDKLVEILSHGSLYKADGNGWDILWRGDGGIQKLQFRVKNFGGLSSVLTSSNLGDLDDEWHHFALTVESQTATFYLDGENVGSVYMPALFGPWSKQELLINKMGDLSPYPVSASFDEISLFKRVLSAEEITQLSDANTVISARSLSQSSFGEIRYELYDLTLNTWQTYDTINKEWQASENPPGNLAAELDRHAMKLWHKSQGVSELVWRIRFISDGHSPLVIDRIGIGTYAEPQQSPVINYDISASTGLSLEFEGEFGSTGAFGTTAADAINDAAEIFLTAALDVDELNHGDDLKIVFQALSPTERAIPDSRGSSFFDMDAYELIFKPGEVRILCETAVGCGFGLMYFSAEYLDVHYLFGTGDEVINRSVEAGPISFSGRHIRRYPDFFGRTLTGLKFNALLEQYAGDAKGHSFSSLTRDRTFFIASNYIRSLGLSLKVGNTGHNDNIFIVDELVAQNRESVIPHDGLYNYCSTVAKPEPGYSKCCGVKDTHCTNKTSPWHPNYKSPDTVQVAIEKVSAAFDEGHFMYSLGVPDGVKYPHYDNTLSDDYYLYANKVADGLRKLGYRPPQHILGLSAYGDVAQAPSNGMVLDPMLFVVSANTGDQYNIEPWLKINPSVGVREYLPGRGFWQPQFPLAGMQANAKYYDTNNIANFRAEAYPMWAFDAPKLYIISRQLWDRDYDVIEGLQHFCDKAFGAANNSMFEFYLLMSSLLDGDVKGSINQPDGMTSLGSYDLNLSPYRNSSRQFSKISRFEQLSQEYYNALQSLLTQAIQDLGLSPVNGHLSCAETDGPCKRLEMIQSFLEYSHNAYWSHQLVNETLAIDDDKNWLGLAKDIVQSKLRREELKSKLDPENGSAERNYYGDSSLKFKDIYNDDTEKFDEHGIFGIAFEHYGEWTTETARPHALIGAMVQLNQNSSGFLPGEIGSQDIEQYATCNYNVSSASVPIALYGEPNYLKEDEEVEDHIDYMDRKKSNKVISVYSVPVTNSELYPSMYKRQLLKSRFLYSNPHPPFIGNSVNAPKLWRIKIDSGTDVDGNLEIHTMMGNTPDGVYFAYSGVTRVASLEDSSNNSAPNYFSTQVATLKPPATNSNWEIIVEPMVKAGDAWVSAHSQGLAFNGHLVVNLTWYPENEGSKFSATVEVEELEFNSDCWQ